MSAFFADLQPRGMAQTCSVVLPNAREVNCYQSLSTFESLISCDIPFHS